MSFGLNDEVLVGALAPEVRHKSAGLAFGLSVLLPGAGQFYCGKGARGGVTLGFWLLGTLLYAGGRQTAAGGTGLGLALVLWIFSFLDAYFTAIEINRGEDAQVDVQNPRVATTLNLLTAGFGYFYLGERSKGMAIFIGTQIVRFGVPRIAGYAGGVVSLVLIVMQMLMAADAYRIARAQLKESLWPEVAAVAWTPAPSRLPAFVPIGLATLVGAGFILLGVVGMAIIAAR